MLYLRRRQLRVGRSRQVGLRRGRHPGWRSGLGMTLGISVILSGCGGAGGQPAAGGSGAPVTISFFNIGATPSAIQYFNKTVIPGFERAYPRVRVQMETSAWGPAFTKMTTAIASHTLADVTYMGGIWLGALVHDHALLPLTEYMSSWKYKGDYSSAVRHQGQVNGIQYAIPDAADVRGLVYNAAYLKQAHLSPPKTINALLADARRLAVHGKGGALVREGMDWGLNSSGGVGLQQGFTQLLYSMGGHEFNAKRTKPAFASATDVKALEFMKKFFVSGVSSPNFVSQSSGAPVIGLGQAAMAVGGASLIAATQLYNPRVAKELRLVPFPAAPGVKPVGLSFTDRVGIYSGTKHPKSAWDFLQYITQPKIESKWAAAIQDVPAASSLAGVSPWNTVVDKAAFALASISHAQPPVPVLLKLGPQEETVLEKVVYGKLAPAGAMAGLQNTLVHEMGG